LLTSTLAGCGGTDTPPSPSKHAKSTGTSDAGAKSDAAAAKSHDAGPPPPADLQELLDLGIDAYLGAARPTGSETIHGVAGVVDGSVVYDFDPADGPICLRGAPFNASVLDQGSDNLVIYMQGGGACVSILCRATTMATPRGVPQLGVLDVTDTDNPVASWNIVYVPYCDGSVFGGDKDFTDPNDTQGVRHHHGLRNFSAALDLATGNFPHPKKVLVTGSSAGGWGTVYHRALVRHVYPDAELSVFDDSGIGFSVNSSYVINEWGSTRYQPPSCDACQIDANMSPFVKYVLEHDPGMVVGDFSAWGDSVIMQFTFNTDATAFRNLLQSETDIPATAFPDRYKRFFINGSQHTSLLAGFHSTKIGDVSVAQWLGMMIARDPGWVETLQ
jgi:hypothetical protein